jgi:iron complex outermembrane receptor protein
MGKYYRSIFCYFISFLVVFLILVAPRVSVGDETKAGKETAKEKVIKLDDVVVRGEVIYENLEATSATVLTNEDITNRVFITPLDMVKLSPGISIRQYKQGGTAASFSMRGFTGCSHGSNVAIYLDGIPLNEGDGYADTNIVNPEEIERVELIKGPVSALYGNYASAGALAFYTKKKVDLNHMKLHYGAYNTYEANYVGGFSSEDKKWDHVYSMQTYHTDGYQDESDWDKMNAAARFTYHFSDALDSTFSIRGFNSDWDAPGYINQEEYDNDPTQAVSDVNGGGKDRVSAKLDFNYRITDESKILFQLWTYDQEFWRWYANDPEGEAAGSIIGNLRNFNRFVWGSGASYNFLGEIAGRELRLIAGVDYMNEDIERERWRLLAGSGREKGPKFWDYHIDMESLGFYTEMNYQVISPLRLILGARYDYFSGDLTDHLSNNQKDSMEDQNIFSPKGGFLLGFLDDRLEFFANYGEGFGLMPGFSEKAAFTQEHWDPQERIQYEVGVRTTPFDWFSGQLLGFRLKTDNDFVYDPVTDNYENIGETTREGIEAAVDFYALDYGYLHADYAYIDATYDKYSSGEKSYNGSTIRSIPDTVVNIELGYNPPEGIGGRLRYHYESEYYLDDANDYTSEAWDTVDAQAFYRFGHKNEYMIALDLVNLFDEKYADYVSGGEEKRYSPGLPLSVYATLTVDF